MAVIIEVHGILFQKQPGGMWRVTPSRTLSEREAMLQEMMNAPTGEPVSTPNEIQEMRWLNADRYLAELTAWKWGGSVIEAPELPSVEDAPGDVVPPKTRKRKVAP
jgi:hypothetical protein